MKLGEYFESSKGRGVLATADKGGKVNLAMYARPYFMDDQTVTFIMAERLTHENLKSNPYAAYLFSEEERKYEGKRLNLRKTKEEKNNRLRERIDYEMRKYFGEDAKRIDHALKVAQYAESILKIVMLLVFGGVSYKLPTWRY
jgi:hypothetical protein